MCKGALCVIAAALALSVGPNAVPQDEAPTVAHIRQHLLSEDGLSPEAIADLAARRKALATALVDIINDLGLQQERPAAVAAAMRLAGELQLMACVPTLAANIRFWAVEPSSIRSESIDCYPGGLALTNMGLAVVPELVKLLRSDDPDEVTLTIFVLCRLPHRQIVMDAVRGEQERTISPVARDNLARALIILEEEAEHGRGGQ